MIQDGQIIYRVQRAPERKVFYIGLDPVPQPTEIQKRIMDAVQNPVIR